MKILDRIKYDGTSNSNDWVIYKADIENIAWGSQLVVGIGQEAVFIKSGKVQDIFTAGTYTLETGNLPLLQKIIESPFGGNTPFTAEIVYVNMSQNLSIKWGTSSPINIEDVKYRLILGLRAFGQYGIRVIDSRILLNKLIGTIPLDTGFNHNLIVQQFNSLINTKIKSLLMKFMVKNKLSFLDIAAYYDEISESALNLLNNEFRSYGIELINFVVESISPPKEQYEQLRKYKEELSLGEGFYNKRRSFDVYEGMSNSPASGIFAAGFGLNAANFAAGGINQLAQNISGTSTAPQSQNSMKCPSCNNEIALGSKFCNHCGQQLPQNKFCPDCGKKLGINDKFCSGCGRRCN